MEGSKGRFGFITKSLRFRLIIICSLIGMVCAGIDSAWSYQTIKEEILDMLDDELTQVAASAINYDMDIPKRWDGPRTRHVSMFRSQSLTTLQDSSLFSEHFLESASDPIIIAPLFGRSEDTIYVPTGINDGLYNIIIANFRARVLLATHTNGQRFVVARSLSVADRLAAKALKITFTEFVVLTLLYAISVVVSMNIIFKAVTKLSHDLAEKQVNNLEPINKDSKEVFIPNEMDGFIDAINQLLARIDDSIRTQKRFIADAAHEMRTPLTALSLQVESLSHERLDPGALEKVRELRKGILREKDLMSSLLALARVQMGDDKPEDTEVNIKDLYVSLVTDLGAIADDKNIDFGIEGEVSSVVRCSVTDLKAVMNNLCSNALKYTPEDGRVDLICTEDENGITLTVRDTGPGIDDEELEKVLEPFYRVGGDTSKHQGTGLGLAIAKAAASRLQADLRLKNAPGGGLAASLIFARDHLSESA